MVGISNKSEAFSKPSKQNLNEDYPVGITNVKIKIRKNNSPLFKNTNTTKNLFEECFQNNTIKNNISDIWNKNYGSEKTHRYIYEIVIELSSHIRRNCMNVGHDTIQQFRIVFMANAFNAINKHKVSK